MTTSNIVKVIFCLLAISSGSNLLAAADSNDSLRFVVSPYEGVNAAKAATDYYLRGKEVSVMGNNAELALKYFAKSLENDPNHAASNFEAANYLPANNALKYSVKANANDPNNYWFREQLAKIYLQLKRFPEAVAETKRMVALKPKLEDAYRTLATYHYYANQRDSAYAVIDTIKVRFGVSDETAFLHNNMIINERTPSDKQLATLLEYANTFNYMPNFYYSLGMISIRSKNVEEALDYFKKARLVDPEDFASSAALYDINLQMGKKIEATQYLPAIFKSPEMAVEKKIEIFNDVISEDIELYRKNFIYIDEAIKGLYKLYPENLEVIDIYAQHLIGAGETESAISTIKSHIDKGRHNKELFTVVIEGEAFHKRYNEAYRYIDKAIELMPEHRQTFELYRIMNLAEEGSIKLASSLLKKEIKQLDSDSTLGDYWAIMGDIKSSAEDTKGAIKAYEKSLQYNSSNIVIMNNLSYILAQTGKRLDYALNLALKSINSEPSNTNYLDTYAWVLYKLGRYTEAREVAAKAVALDTSNSATLFLHYGDILNKVGNRTLAEMYWRKSLENGMNEKDILDRMGTK